MHAVPDTIVYNDIYNAESKMHGAFTNLALTGLEGRADKHGDGMVSNRELRAHLTKKYSGKQKTITFRGLTRSPGGGTKEELFIGHDIMLDTPVLRPVTRL